MCVSRPMGGRGPSMSPRLAVFRGALAASLPEGPDSEHVQIIRHAILPVFQRGARQGTCAGYKTCGPAGTWRSCT